MDCNWSCPVKWNLFWWVVNQSVNYLMSGATDAPNYVMASDLQQ